MLPVRLMRTAGLALVLGVSVLAACSEEHKSTAIRNAPEYLHDALSGDVAAQASLADCFDKDSHCNAPDPAMACAWRGVRLSSGSPELSLADVAAFRTACASTDQSTRQRASITLADYVSRIYGRPAGERAQLPAELADRPILYPSINTVRENINRALVLARRSEQLPQFLRSKPTADSTIQAWSSCAADLCLEGLTPTFGGGVISYRVTFKSGAAAKPDAATLVIRLGVAGLESPSAGDWLLASATPSVVQGPVCWTKGRDRSGVVYSLATPSPCRPATTAPSP
jgi:hypothetical protein